MGKISKKKSEPTREGASKFAARMRRARRPQKRTDKPTYEEQRQFAATKFKWLTQIALDHAELLPLTSSWAILQLPKFNLEYDGAPAWANQDTSAEELGCSRETVKRLFARVVERGHVAYQRGGWGVPNYYRMVIKEAVTDVTNSSHSHRGTGAPGHRLAAGTRRWRAPKTRTHTRRAQNAVGCLL
jgi:hypothetical protein